jgi:4-hydroxythreonine-4-phosphate dehydrogenase
MILKSCKIRVGITLGDPSGIGPIITHKAIRKLNALRDADFVVIGDRWVFDQAQSAKRRTQSFRFIDLKNVSRKNFQFGKVKAEYGRASIEYLDKALELIKKGEIDCLVTCPISKESINKSGFKCAGHTEYLAERTETEGFLMLLLNKKLKVSLVTRHSPLKVVPPELNKDKIYKTILLTYKAMLELFLIKNPRIVVCGLNPHASDNGLIGLEENLIIKPVLRVLRKRIKFLDGPISSDVAILKASNRRYDCVVAMYHDQALIPLKLTGAKTGVNLTFGLPFVRTSPLHGTAFDIAANKSQADPSSLIEAIKLAVRCSQNLKKI